MPTLRISTSDGHYYILHWYQQHATWQILGEGVHYLARRHVVNDGQSFPTDLFMELYDHRLVYHGGAQPIQISQGPELGDTGTPNDLRLRVVKFNRLLFSRQAEAAWHLLWVKIPLETFSTLVNSLHLESWVIRDIVIPSNVGPLLHDGATRLGVVHVGVKEQGADDTREIKQFWFESGGQWQILWAGLDGEA